MPARTASVSRAELSSSRQTSNRARSSSGLPGTNGFIGEFTILLGAFGSTVLGPGFAIVAVIGVTTLLSGARLLGLGTPCTGPFPPESWAFNKDVKGYPYDPAKARRLLAEAGYPDGVEITLDSPDGRYQGDKEIAEGSLTVKDMKSGDQVKVKRGDLLSFLKT